MPKRILEQDYEYDENGLLINPDWSKYEIKFRGGKHILVDRAVMRWQKRNRKFGYLRRRKKAIEKKEEEKSKPLIWNIFE